MVETGIPKLDDYLGGGIPKGKSMVYYTHPGVEGDIFAIQTLYHNLKRGMKGVLVTTSPPSVVRAQFREFGWDLERYKENLFVVDGYSALVGASSEEAYQVENPEQISSVDEAVNTALKEVGNKAIIVFDSLSTIMDMAGEASTLEYVERWNKYGLLYDHVMIYDFTAWPYSENTLERIKGDLFNAVVIVGGIAERIVFKQYFGVTRVDWTEPRKASMLFRVLRPGGIRIYIPKILVTGPFDAGKSTFVKALSTRSISVDRLGTTIALDHGHVDHKGFSADIFGTPGQERFDPVIRLISGEAMGVILLVDSTKPGDFPRAKQMLEITKGYGLPFIIVANKQDTAGALGIDEMRDKIKLPKDVPIVPAVASEGKGVFEAFETLIDMITEVE